MKKLSYIKEWYEIAGNHDVKDGGMLYRKKIKSNLHYSFTKGNILFIFMSDEKRSKETNISDETFRWWQDLVVNNQDKIIVVVTHAPLKNTLPISTWKIRQIKDSERFKEVMKDYRVDVWLSGHIHFPNNFPGDVTALDRTVFVDVSAIRNDFFRSSDIESRILVFLCGSDNLFVRSRNHYREKYDNELDTVLKLSKEYKCE